MPSIVIRGPKVTILLLKTKPKILAIQYRECVDGYQNAMHYCNNTIIGIYYIYTADIFSFLWPSQIMVMKNSDHFHFLCEYFFYIELAH